MSHPSNTYDPRRWRRERWDEPGTIYFFEAMTDSPEAALTQLQRLCA